MSDKDKKKKNPDIDIQPQSNQPVSQEQLEEALSGEDIEFYETSPTEIIASCFNALTALDGLEGGIITEIERNRIRRIRRKSLQLLDYSVNELHEEVFGKPKKGDDNDEV